MDADRRRIVERDDPQLEMKGVPEDKEVLNKWVGINAAFEMDKALFSLIFTKKPLARWRKKCLTV